ncbi:hypothetical protein MA16_Dca000145 [Dendrobium catenatum]|uniref:Uncharacterized protein n=1 Tax=Dendrobium catenatum TaxID=906689 RepID=A0A2I0WT12_9ASPA|nr:hypothetical protein MA16_Dca000145 [Dendrobium catenatum]
MREARGREREIYLFCSSSFFDEVTEGGGVGAGCSSQRKLMQGNGRPGGYEMQGCMQVGRNVSLEAVL